MIVRAKVLASPPTFLRRAVLGMNYYGSDGFTIAESYGSSPLAFRDRQFYPEDPLRPAGTPTSGIHHREPSLPWTQQDRTPTHSNRNSFAASSFGGSHLHLDDRGDSKNVLLPAFPYPDSHDPDASTSTLPAYPPSRKTVMFIKNRLRRRRKHEGVEEEERTEELDRRVRSGKSRQLLGIDLDILGGDGWTPIGSWPRAKWFLLLSVLAELGMGGVMLAMLLRIWFDSVPYSDVVRIVNPPQLIVATASSSLAIAAGLLGLIGVALNNRAFLAVYNCVLWIGLASMAAVGYLSYKMRAYNLQGKLSEAWSRTFLLQDRLQLQNTFNCCGFTDPFTEAVLSQQCFSRSTLQGCIGPFLRYERRTLETFYIVAFTLCVVQFLIITTALLTSNHVTNLFGHGSTPREYRLAMAGKTAKHQSDETSAGSSQS